MNFPEEKQTAPCN